MSALLQNLYEFVRMIFGVIVTPNYAAASENFNLLRYLFTPNNTDYFVITSILLITFGIGLAGVSIGILKRFLWKS